MRAWYLIYSKPREERLALLNLEQQGYNAYLPLIRNRRRRQGGYIKLVEPMFPRYLFVRLSDETDNWGPIRSTVGVASLVRFGLQPARLPNDLVDILRSREDEMGVQQVEQREFRPGDGVRIVEGIMAGYEGVFSARSGKERVSILLEIANTTARVEVSGDNVEPLSLN